VTELARLVFGGNIHAGSSPLSPVVEIWESSISFAVDDGTDYSAGVATLYGILADWFTSADAHIANNCYLDYAKWNHYSLATGRQITDPTVATLSAGVNAGASGSSQPLTTSYRISIDDATRDPRHRGGFYVPRTAADVQDTGRFSGAVVAAITGAAQGLFDAFNTLFAGSGNVCVWSRADKQMHLATRFRIGDVPDNISRRKNALREAYSGGTV
jgi:hypothetical protein